MSIQYQFKLALSFPPQVKPLVHLWLATSHSSLFEINM